ncbi:disease resistance protein RML1A-like [Vitis riparia]|uniref:disease resistance protein RML1A-like n=1 Tax=Vitis riparia TaxID=96939 RepID=UPI00155B3B93|nr:disease resistance protein RML1A-like [Vitis riparia]
MDSSSSSLASSISSSSDWKYAVFLSFRGEDTRNNFTGHLYKALDQKGIETFMDDKKLRTGEEISPTLVTAIQRSRCSIIVLSENYASSKWCLEELVMILECKRTKNLKVVPIFYNVDPSHVRNQTGSFGEALAKHKENLKIKVEKVQKWREALTQVANLSGLHSVKNKPEAQLIEEIIADISKDLYSVPLKDAPNLVAVDSCIRELESLLCLPSMDVRMVGIWGMGGIGKTTLARAIYEQISGQFEGCCFLPNVEHLASKGDDYLRKELLSKVLRDKNIDVTITSVKARFHSKKVLIVIDNVNHRSILKTLVGELDWFGPQSRIIITTRDKHVLTMHGVDVIYEVQKLQDDKATELFNHHAFINHPPTEDVMELSQRVIAYAQGLPLALEVLGSSLCKKSKDEWECALNKLEKIPDMEIRKVLQTSFDELDDDQKNIFLDIAIFFNEVEEDFTTEMLNSFGFSAISGIRTLIDKSLIRNLDDELHMHDLLIEMGKEIVRRTSPKEPGKRTRLWEQQDICHVLEKNMGTDEVEVIDFNLSGLKEICFTTEAFGNMSKLRLLAIHESSFSDDSECSSRLMQCQVHISDDFKFHYDELRLLMWEEYPLKSLPSDFKSQNLVFLSMTKSHLTRLWEGNRVFKNLKYIDLSDSKYLAETPDFSRVANLKILNFEGCTQLRKIHSSLGDLDKLIGLSFKNCINLEHFPGLDQLVSLEALNLSGCSKLEKFPVISQPMPCLSKLCFDGTAITELPSSIAYATKLVVLDLQNCEKLLSLPSSICKLAHLETLSLSGCSRLGKPQVNSDNLDALPRILDRLSHLRELQLQDCRSLRALPPLPSSMELINASDNCTSLEYISPQSVFLCFGGSIFGNCFQLTKYQSKMGPHLRRMATHFDQDRWKSAYDQQYPNVQVPFSTVFPGSTIPDWFMHYSKGHEVDIDVDPDWYDSSFLGFALSAVIAPKDGSITRGWSTYCNLDLHDLNSESESESSWVCSFTDARTCQLEDTTINSDHLWLAYVPSFLGFNDKKWSRIKFSFSTSRKSCIVKHWGVCPLYIEGSSDDNYNHDGDYSSGRCCLNEGLGVQTSNDNNIDDEGNACGSVLDDLREWGLEDIIIRRSPEDDQPSGQVYEDANGTHAWNQERLRMQPNPLIAQTSYGQYTHERNPAKSVLDYRYESTFEDGIVRMRSLLEEYPGVIGFSPTDSHSWDQERLGRQPNPPISNSETGFWICITIFSFFFLAHIFHSASFRISPLLGVLLLLFIFSRL